MSQVQLESNSENWGTPDVLFNQISAVWGPFDLDAAADEDNAKASWWYGSYLVAGERQFTDGLTLPWLGRVFCNPPFNRAKKLYVGPWVKKAVEEAENGNAELVVMLLPARTDTKWWQDLVMTKADEVYFVRGRVKFVQDGKTNSATFPSAIVIFKQGGNSRPVFDVWTQAP